MARNHRLQDLEERALWPFTSAGPQITGRGEALSCWRTSLVWRRLRCGKILAETSGLKHHRSPVLSQKALAARDGALELAQRPIGVSTTCSVPDKQMASMWSRIRVDWERRPLLWAVKNTRRP